MISAELKEVQESKNVQIAQVIRSLAELNILNKEMKHMDADYLQASKKFDSSFRVYMAKYGKTRLKKYDIGTFNKIAQQRKKVDYVANLNTELGSAFLKFTTSNLLKIKSEEVKFYETLQKIKKKSWKYVESKDQQKSHDEPDEQSQLDSPSKGNRFEQLKLEQSPRTAHNRLVETKNREFESPLAKPNAKQLPLNEDQPQKQQASKKVDASRNLLIRTTPSRDKPNPRLPEPNPKLHIDIQTEHIAKVRQPVVERIKIERGNYSDDESDGST